MHARFRFRWIFAYAAIAAVLCATGTTPAAARDFVALRALAGEWTRVDGDGEQVVSGWRVTAAGTAVIETLFPGTDREMVTVYHPDGEDLVLTHYCIAGNAPRMRARPSGTDRLEFRCEGGANLSSEKDAHMHHAVIEWVDEDHIRARWVMHENGTAAHTANFDLVRRR